MKKHVKLLLINIIDPKVADWHPALNLIMLADYLIENRAVSEKNIKIINTYFNEPTRFISVFKPDIIGCSVMTPSYDYALTLAKKIKKVSSALLIVGGYHISGLPTLLDDVFDLGIIGEGEQPLLDVVRLYNKEPVFKEKDLKNIPNVVYKTKKGIVKVNPMRLLLKPEEIPHLRHSLLTKEKFIEYMPIIKNRKAQLARSTKIFTARGCPYRCKFCAAQIIWKGKHGLRMFPIKRVGDEVEYLYHKHKINSIHIWDDTFAVTKKRLEDLIQELSHRNLLGKVSFYHLYVRANLVDDEFVQLLKMFGAVSVYIGFESGSDRILGYLKNKSLTTKQIRQAVSLISKAGIEIFGSFMLFSPGEKEKDLKESYKLATWLVKKHNVNIFPIITCPFPGTELWDEAVRQKKIDVTNIRWNDFVLWRKTKESPKIFFTNNLSNKTRMKYWEQFQNLAKHCRQKRYSTIDYKKIQSLAQKKNEEIGAQMIKRLAYQESFIRLSRFIHNPFKSINSVLNDPNKIKVIINQMFIMIRSSHKGFISVEEQRNNTDMYH